MSNNPLLILSLALCGRMMTAGHLSLPLLPGSEPGHDRELVLRASPGYSDPLLGRGYALYARGKKLDPFQDHRLGHYSLKVKNAGGEGAELLLSYRSTPCRIYRFTCKRGILAGKKLTGLIVYDGRRNFLYEIIFPGPISFRSDG